MQREVLNISGLDVLEDSVEDLILESNTHFPDQKVTGVRLGR